jgi:hypothetical protein
MNLIDKVIDLKIVAIERLLWEAAASLRSIENNFKNQYLRDGEYPLEPNLVNFIILLRLYIKRTNDIESKKFLISILRDLTIINILDK